MRDWSDPMWMFMYQWARTLDRGAYTEVMKRDIRKMLESLARFIPCGLCRGHFMERLSKTEFHSYEDLMDFLARTQYEVELVEIKQKLSFEEWDRRLAKRIGSFRPSMFFFR